MFKAWRWRGRATLGATYIGRKTSVRAPGGRPTGRWMMLHRQTMGLRWCDGREVDHRNGDPLDNRVANLRIVTRAENNRLMNERRREDAR